MNCAHGGARSGRQGAGGPAHRACHVDDAQGGPVDPDGREHHGAQALGRHRRPERPGRQPGQEEHALLGACATSLLFFCSHMHKQAYNKVPSTVQTLRHLVLLV